MLQFTQCPYEAGDYLIGRYHPIGPPFPYQEHSSNVTTNLTMGLDQTNRPPSMRNGENGLGRDQPFESPSGAGPLEPI